MKRAVASEAEEELTKAALWYEERRDGLGIELIEEAERVFDLVVENPRLYQVVHLDIRRANLRRFPLSPSPVTEGLWPSASHGAPTIFSTAVPSNGRFSWPVATASV